MLVKPASDLLPVASDVLPKSADVSRAIVLAEISYRLEVRHQAAGQPNQFDVALAFPLQTPA